MHWAIKRPERGRLGERDAEVCAVASVLFRATVWPEVTYISFFEGEEKEPSPHGVFL